MRLIHRGLSLVEVAIVLTLISVMMALSLPMLSTANARARSKLCQENLVEIGQVIVSHTQDTGRLPALHNLAPTQPGLSLPEFIEPRLHIPKVLFCPSDETQTSQALGTSYRWATAFNNQSPGALRNMLGQPMLADREAYHANAVQPINEVMVVEDDAGVRLAMIGEDPRDNAVKSRPDLYLNKKPKRPTHPNE